MSAAPLRSVEIPSPLGPVLAWLTGEVVVALGFEPQRASLAARVARRFGAAAASGPAPSALARAIEAYFAGELEALASLPADPGGTAREAAVWSALRRVPAGEVVTYAELAQRIGAPASASRAVGVANAHNPVSLLIPCHRVVGSDGSLRGYAGGLDRKRWLLRHEDCDLGGRAARART